MSADGGVCYSTTSITVCPSDIGISTDTNTKITNCAIDVMACGAKWSFLIGAMGNGDRNESVYGYAFGPGLRAGLRERLWSCYLIWASAVSAQTFRVMYYHAASTSAYLSIEVERRAILALVVKWNEISCLNEVP
jgi:hypothetical protein